MSQLNNQVIVDSNIFLDVIGGFDDNDSTKSREILKKIEDGVYHGIIIAPCITEIYYQIANKSDDSHAKQFVKTILSMNNLEVIPVGREESLKAGMIWSKYNKGKKKHEWLSVVDCLIISIGSLLDGVSVLSWELKFRQIDDVKIVNPSSV